VIFYDLAPQNSHLFGNTFQKFKQLHSIITSIQQKILLYGKTHKKRASNQTIQGYANAIVKKNIQKLDSDSCFEVFAFTKATKSPRLLYY
jgi:hypothetical protein